MIDEVDSGLCQISPLPVPEYDSVPLLGAASRNKTENDEEMDTQPLTQPFEDPRVRGEPSTPLEGQDEADILCILHPSSRPAIDTVKLVLDSTPQHILMNQDKKVVPGSARDAQADSGQDESGSDDSRLTATTPKVSTGNSFGPYQPDIALRMSSAVRDIRMGFVFGRNPKKCDILLAEEVNRVSSAHFRIYVNQHGILMLEDMSLNGTYVDGNLLKSLKADPSVNEHSSTRTISHGSIVEIPVIPNKNGEWIRFVARFPKRDVGEQAYADNLLQYLTLIKQEERRAEVTNARGNMPPPRPMPFAPLRNTADYDSAQASKLAIATNKENHGMMWSGGSKYNVVNYVGKGAFAMVYKLSNVRHGEVFACKQIEKRRFIKDGQPGQKMHHEIEIMKRISHPNIVQFVDYHETEKFMFIVMEFVPLGDLTAYTAGNLAMHEGMGQRVASQICAALKYLHGQKITHRDIKPDNILVACHIPYVFKLSDFGLSKIMKNDESQMLTFCGTILYCAPEIYPGFQRAQQGVPFGKAGRGWRYPPEQTLPYEYSVDTWGIAAVLFHLLCGHPAWTGSYEDGGATMLNNIIRNPIDWERLTLAGVSDTGIDFLKRMLVIDPVLRASEDEVLAHPWITEVFSQAVPRSSNDQAEDLMEDEVPDASQLRIDDNAFPFRLDGSSQLEAAVERDAQKGSDDPQEFENDDFESAMVPDEAIETLLGHPRYTIQGPRHPANYAIATEIDRARAGTKRHDREPLFGEIPSSALASSGVLGQRANAALDMDIEGSMEGTTNISSVDSDFPGPNDFSAESRFSNRTLHHHTSITHHQHNLQYPQPLSVPLRDMQNLTDPMDMASPESGKSGPSTESKTASPKTPASRDMSPSRSGSKRASQHWPSDNLTASKRIKSGRTKSSTSLDIKENNTQARRASSRIKTKEQEQASEARQSASHQSATAVMDATVVEDGQVGQSEKGKETAHKDGLLSPPSILSRLKTSEKQIPYKVRKDPDELHHEHLAHEEWKKAHPINTREGQMEAERAKNPSKEAEQPVGPDLNTFIEPYTKTNPYLAAPIVFGVLTPTADSIRTVDAIIVNNRATTFGRDASCTFVHPSEQEAKVNVRVPRSAINLTMWYKGLDEEIDAKTLPENWYANPNIVCIISTKKKNGGAILINDVPLQEGVNCWKYGRLRTNDTVTVFAPKLDPEETATTPSSDRHAHLKFTCFFHHGASKPPRTADELFKVEVEEGKFRDNIRKLASKTWTRWGDEARAEGKNRIPPGGRKDMKPGEWDALKQEYKLRDEANLRKSAERRAARLAGGLTRATTQDDSRWGEGGGEGGMKGEIGGGDGVVGKRGGGGEEDGGGGERRTSSGKSAAAVPGNVNGDKGNGNGIGIKSAGGKGKVP